MTRDRAGMSRVIFGAATPRPHLYLELDTFESFEEHGERLVPLLERVRTDVVEPALQCASVALEPVWTMTPRIGSSTRQYRFTEKNWQLLLDRTAAGEVGELVFDVVGTREDPALKLLLDRLQEGRLDVLDEVTELLAATPPSRSHLMIDFCLRERSEYTTDWAYHFSVRCSPDLVGGEPTPEVSARWAALGAQAACALDAVTGYLTYDDHGGGADSPYENRFGLHDGLAFSREYARGYYWGNFLGPEQVRRLGGMERIREAPCRVIERVCDEPEIVYLQLTDDIRTISDDDLRALRDFLRPVLRPVTKQWDYLGPKRRVLDEP
jgi:hypothetical protein